MLTLFPMTLIMVNNVTSPFPTHLAMVTENTSLPMTAFSSNKYKVFTSETSPTCFQSFLDSVVHGGNLSWLRSNSSLIHTVLLPLFIPSIPMHIILMTLNIVNIVPFLLQHCSLNIIYFVRMN